MAYHMMGAIQRRAYSASNASSSTAAVFAVPTRSQLLTVFQAGKVSLASTAVVGSWTVSVNGAQASVQLSSVAVPATATAAGAAGVQNTSASPASPVYLNRGDIISVVGSSLVSSNFTFIVREF